MDLDEALGYALDKKAVLFCGAGFSQGAININGGQFKTGKELAKHFSNQAGLPDDTELEDAAEEFINVKGRDNLIVELQGEFTVKQVADWHVRIAKVPWKRIYTTNYDNILETAYSQASRSLTTVTLSDDIYQIVKKDTLCVHLNGFVERLSRDRMLSEIKLADTSYITSSVVESPWAAMFRLDLKMARSVFFVGYSLYDLDIKRLLYESPDLAGRCFFVVGNRADSKTKRRVSRFGERLDFDTKSFDDKIDDKKKVYVPTDSDGFAGYSLKQYEPAADPRALSDQEVFDLLLLGDVNASRVWQALHDGLRYFLERAEVTSALDRLEKGARIVIIHSDLGNGKSLVLEGIKGHAVDKGYIVYEVVTRTDELLSELQFVLTLNQKTLIVVDNYPDWMDVVEQFGLIASDTAVLVLAARTGVHDIMIDQVCSLVGVASLPEISVDKLRNSELEWIVQFFNEYGLWGEHASWSSTRKMNFFQQTCNSEFHAILVKVLESPDIIARLGNVLNQLRTKSDFYEVIVAILILTVLVQSMSVDTLIDLCGTEVLDSEFRRNRVVKELIDVSRGTVRLRSSVSARFILTTAVEITVIITVLSRLTRAANNNSKLSPYYMNLFKNLMRFSSLQYLLPDRKKLTSIITYYETVKNLENCRTNPLFWLQYAICCTVHEDFPRAGKYFDTAYSYANARDYDTFQIDNHYARYLLMSTIRGNKSDLCMSKFREVHEIIAGQIKRERLHYPYRVASNYAEFYDQFSPQLSDQDRQEIGKAAKFVLDRIDRLPDFRQNQKHVKKCREAMKNIIDRIG